MSLNTVSRFGIVLWLTLINIRYKLALLYAYNGRKLIYQFN